MTDQDHKLGEVLRAAREAKEVDLIRVERDTKIRERYLSALERGEYRELPGAVYTKGFLRNYGAYLGLDPEYLIDLYRLETSSIAAERPSSPGPPRPITVRRRRTFVVTPGAVAAAILTILVGAFVAWLGYEFVNFARTPELRIVEPAGDVAAHTESSITIRGVTSPDATITVSGLPENPTTTADADGNFEMTLGLLPGSNEIRLQAMDPVTDRPSAVSVVRVNVVSEVEPSPSVGGVAVTLDQPEADATITGPVAVSGTAAPGEEIVLSAVLVTAPTPTFTVTDDGRCRGQAHSRRTTGTRSGQHHGRCGRRIQRQPVTAGGHLGRGRHAGLGRATHPASHRPPRRRPRRRRSASTVGTRTSSSRRTACRSPASRAASATTASASSMSADETIRILRGQCRRRATH